MDLRPHATGIGVNRRDLNVMKNSGPTRRYLLKTCIV
jgi:hypothetical protein